MSGEVTAVNSKLQNNPELVNTDPHGEAWLIRVRLADRGEIDKLMTADEYEAYIQQEKPIDALFAELCRRPAAMLKATGQATSKNSSSRFRRNCGSRES